MSLVEGSLIQQRLEISPDTVVGLNLVIRYRLGFVIQSLGLLVLFLRAHVTADCSQSREKNSGAY